jgi:hypothetical protein
VTRGLVVASGRKAASCQHGADRVQVDQRSGAVRRHMRGFVAAHPNDNLAVRENAGNVTQIDDWNFVLDQALANISSRCSSFAPADRKIPILQARQAGQFI